MAFTYLIHGLALELPFECAELGEPQPGLAGELCVVEGDVPRRLERCDHSDRQFDVTADRFLYRGGQQSARFLAEGGRRITYHKNGKWQEPLFLHQLLYQVMAATLWQRGLVVFHASGALSPLGAVLVTGLSGAGKSTTVAALEAQGWPLLSDDVCAIRLESGGRLVLLPGTRHLHLNEGSSDRLGLDTTGLTRHVWHRMKAAVPAAHQIAQTAQPIRKIVYLSQGPALSIESVRGRDKLTILLKCIYGPLLPQQITAYSEALATALRDVEMIAVVRPAEGWTLDEIVRAIVDG